MKTKYILLTLLCITLVGPSHAQILKKIKKKAQQAAERTILNKTEEVVTGTTEKTIDGVTEGKDNDPEAQNTGNTSNTSNKSKQVNPAMNPMGAKNMDTSNLPNSYTFDWEFKTEITSSEGEKIEMNYLLNSNSKDYAGMEMSTEESKQQGTVSIVLDAKANAAIMFMEANGQKMAQLSKLPDPNSKRNNDEFTFKEIGTKTILGFECFGIEVENKGYKSTMYYTLDAPVSFSALFSFSKNSAPKGFDPALIEILNEEALLMEMFAENKKKKNENFLLTAKSLNKKNNEIHKKDYQFMKMGF
ncbi:uncharacterized protein DUF4412 [Flavobacteriaceae bacterium MAR_2010_72]|nr:uncharacterized protein DUF4412 [Flavobacteriaceae bacterium MAR_2010_72]TVZ58843.1 uncharacterized protein DUF4412 [Flavobacteriaceae bacterium MAR_2010_105]